MSPCPECGVEMPAALPFGVCTSCLLTLGLGREAHGSPTPLPAEGEDTGAAGSGASGPARQRFGDYELLEEVARGGMGVVYRARQVSLDRIVAVKVILAGQFASGEQMVRFRAEAEAAARLQHPNIVAIHETGEHEGRPFFSMDFVTGGDLASLVRHRPLAAKHAAALVRTLAEAIHYAHEQGVLHRDLKPSNVLLNEAGQPLITDFGLARRVGKDSFLTVTGQVLGSPNFMPPEQAGAKLKAGRPNDVYALGGILFYLVTGRPPFVAETVLKTLQQVRHSEPVSPRLLNPAVPVDLATLCLKCLEKDPGRRYATAEELAEELGRFLANEPVRARPLGRAEKVSRWCRRKPALAGLAGALLATVILGVAGVVTQWRRAETRGQDLQRQGQELRRTLYAADLKLAEQALAVNDLGRTLDLLARHRSEPNPRAQISDPGSAEDLRGWEWRYLWRQTRGDDPILLCLRSNAIASLAVSADGALLAVGEEEKGKLSVWGLHTRRLVAELEAGEGAVTAAFSPDRPLLAYAESGGVSGIAAKSTRSQLHLWDAAARKEVADFSLGGIARRLAFSGDGRSLLATTTDPDNNRLSLWPLPSAVRQATHDIGFFQASVGAFLPFSVTPQLSRVAFGMPGGRIRVTNPLTGAGGWTARATPDNISALALSPDGKTLASASGMAPAPIRLWDTASGKEFGRLEGHRGWVSALVFLPDGRSLASASGDQTIRVWDLRDLGAIPPALVLRGHRTEILELVSIPGTTRLISGGKDGTVHLWETTAAARDGTASTVPGQTVNWCFTPDGRSILTVGATGQVVRWHGDGFRAWEVLLETGPRVWGAVFSADARWLAVANGSTVVGIWDLPRRSLAQTIADESGYPLRFLRGDRRLVLGHVHTDLLHEWDWEAGQRTATWHGGVDGQAVAFSTDGRWCLTRRFQGGAVWRDLTFGRETQPTLDLRMAMGLAFSPDGRLAAAASWHGWVKLWDTTTWREIATLRSFLQGATSVAFSPDGRRLVAGSDGREALKLWDVESRQELLTLAGEGSRFDLPAFSPDGGALGALNHDGVLHLWRAPSWAEIAAEEKRAPGGRGK